MMTRVQIIVPFLLATLSLGCLSTETMVLPERVRTVGIPMFRNLTLEPGVEEHVTDVLVREFLRDGRLQVVRPAAADALLQGEVVGYDIRGRQYDDQNHAIGFVVDVVVKLRFVDAHTGEALGKPRAFRQGGVFFDSPQPGQARQDDVFIRLSEEILSYYLEGW